MIYWLVLYSESSALDISICKLLLQLIPLIHWKFCSRHQDFPRGRPSQYWPGLAVLCIGVLMGSSLNIASPISVLTRPSSSLHRSSDGFQLKYCSLIDSYILRPKKLSHNVSSQVLILLTRLIQWKFRFRHQDLSRGRPSQYWPGLAVLCIRVLMGSSSNVAIWSIAIFYRP